MRQTAYRPGSQRGITLLELLIAIVIVGILAAVALPSYQESLNKGRRADAKAAMLDVANRQEQLMLDRGTYSVDMRDLGFDADPFTSEEGYYSIDAVACTGIAITRCYQVTATPVAGSAQANDARCYSFSLDSSGTKLAKTKAGAAADDYCW